MDKTKKDIVQTSIINGEKKKFLSSKEKLIAPLFNEKGMLFWLNKKAVREFNATKYPSEFNLEHIGAFCVITKELLMYGTNFLTITVKDKVRPADFFDIVKILNKSEKQTSRYMSAFIKHRMIAKLVMTVGDEIINWYVINPIYCLHGKRISPELYFLFKEDLDFYLTSYCQKSFEEYKNKYMPSNLKGKKNRFYEDCYEDENALEQIETMEEFLLEKEKEE